MCIKSIDMQREAEQRFQEQEEERRKKNHEIEERRRKEDRKHELRLIQMLVQHQPPTPLIYSTYNHHNYPFNLDEDND